MRAWRATTRSDAEFSAQGTAQGTGTARGGHAVRAGASRAQGRVCYAGRAAEAFGGRARIRASARECGRGARTGGEPRALQVRQVRIMGDDAGIPGEAREGG